jgi:clan AA aspartic protease (TIGR02281 family)
MSVVLAGRCNDSNNLAFDQTQDDRAAVAELLRETIGHDRFPIACGLRRQRVIILAIAAVVAMPSLGAAQALTGCQLGQLVDDRGLSATIVGELNGACLLKYKDGRTQRWVSSKELTAGPPSAPANAATSPFDPPARAGSATTTEGVKILRPQVINRLVYRADALGHIVITAKVNGAPVQFLVDTGATLVSLTTEDASAAGLKPSELNFDQTVHTGNGPVHAAFTELREIRIEQLEIDHVPVAVINSLKQSVLGMSFLSRLKGFEVHDGALTISW